MGADGSWISHQAKVPLNADFRLAVPCSGRKAAWRPEVTGPDELAMRGRGHPGPLPPDLRPWHLRPAREIVDSGVTRVRA
jgi:hypothetical protein